MLKGQKNILWVLTERNKNILFVFIIILFNLVIYSGAKVSALGYQNNVGVSFTFEPVLAINLSSNALIIDNLAPGNSAYSNTITVNVDTNNIAGYTLSAKVGDGTTYTNDKLTNTTSNTVFNNLSSSSNLTLAEFNDNDWGYALGTISGSTTYSGLTYNVDTVINATTNNTGTAASSGCVSTCSGTNNTDFTIAAKAAATQASGDYSNVIIFTVVGNVPPMTIGDLTYMQDFTSLSASEKTEVLTSMTEGQGYPLLDKRDNKTYRIAKLKDGNAWMLDNLALDIVETSLARLKGDTNASDTTLEYLKGVSSRNAANEPNGNYPTSGVGYFDTNDYYSIPKIAINGDCNDTNCVNDPESGKWTSNSIAGAKGKMGIYYNYCAASAGSYCYGNGTSYTGSPESDPDPDPNSLRDVTEDICPSGWRLPTSDTGSTPYGEFRTLYNLYQVADFMTALSTPLSGSFGSGKAYNQGISGYFWSSTWLSTNSMSNLRIYTGSVHPSNGNNRYIGFSVRCILGS